MSSESPPASPAPKARPVATRASGGAVLPIGVGDHALSTYRRRKNRLLVAILAVVLSAAALAAYTFYSLTFSELRTQLDTIARNHTRLLEAGLTTKKTDTARFLASFNARAATPESISGISVHFSYGKLDTNLITVFSEGLERSIMRFATDAPVAEPMRRALAGRAGTMIGFDHTGEEVLAAYQPVPGWSVGVVLKIPVSAIRAPFVIASSIGAPIVIIAIVILQILVLRVTKPLIRHVERSEAYNDLVADAVVDGLLAVNDDGAITSINAAGQEMFGVTRPQILGSHIHRILPAVLPGSTAREIGAFLRREGDRLAGARLDGSTFPVEASASELRQGRLSFLAIDIKRAEDAGESTLSLRQHHNAKQTVIAKLGQQALEGIDANRIFDEVATAVCETLDVASCRIWQYVPRSGELELRAASSFFPDLDKSDLIPTGTASQAGYALLVNQSVVTDDYRTETRFQRLDIAAEEEVASAASVVIPAKNHSFGVLTVHTKHRRRFAPDDIRFLECVADVLALAHQRWMTEKEWQCLATVFEGGSESVAITDPDGGVAYVNPSFERFTGYTRSELSGRSLAVLHHEGSNSWLCDAAARRLAEGNIWEDHAVDRMRDGTLVRTSRTIIPVHDTTGTLVNYVVFLRDPAVAGDMCAGSCGQRAEAEPEAVDPGIVRVLIADDNLGTRNTVVRQVSSLGYATEAVANGFQVLDAIENGDYDIVLMDCSMPDMDGFEATSEIRRREGPFMHTTIIGMTAHKREAIRERCLAVGMDDYIGKPAYTSDIKRVLEKWLFGLHGYPGAQSLAVSAREAGERLEALARGLESRDGSPRERAEASPDADSASGPPPGK